VRSRILASFVALLVISTAASLIVLQHVLMSRIDEQIERQLTNDVDPLRSMPATPKSVNEIISGFVRQTPPPADGAFIAFVNGELVAVDAADPDIETLTGSFESLADLNAPSSGVVDTNMGEAQYVAITVRSPDAKGVLVATALTEPERDEVESAVRIAIGVSLVVLLLASLFIWLAAGRAVAPIQALARPARALCETDLSRRIPVRGNDEIAELGRTFNGMLDRLEAAFAGQKDFLTDVSHELRTPITVIRGNLETLGSDPVEREEAIAVIQDELDRLNRFVDDLLLLTKAPRPDFLRPAPIDLDLFTHDLFAKARSLASRTWRLDATGVGIFVGDQHRLTQAVMNLAENAVRHTREGDAIRLGSSHADGEIRLWVSDRGPGIDPEDQERIFQRYERVRSGHVSAAQDGAGLGLAIVQAVAEAHGGTVELASDAGLGATFTIILPAPTD
jgi:two-component system OmpR family sensor kinase